MKSFIQDHQNKNEAGGVLLGRIFDKSGDLIIDDVSAPQPSDKRHRFKFFRTQFEHQKIINEAWKKSNGIQNYLGEWHTHPEPIPTPSKVDIKNWLAHIQKAKFEGDGLIFVIIGTEGFCTFEIRRKDSIIYNLFSTHLFKHGQ